jgi:hypothetical protein
MIATLAFVLFVLCGGQEEPAQEKKPASSSEPLVSANLIYLPDKGKTAVSVFPESSLVVRTTMDDSTLKRTVRGLDDTLAPVIDSLRMLLERLPEGRREKTGAIDGTRIEISYRGKEIVCDRCLHDYVMREIGIDAANPPKSLRGMRAAVRLINDLVVLTERQQEQRIERGKAVEELGDTLRKVYGRSIQFPARPEVSNQGVSSLPDTRKPAR